MGYVQLTSMNYFIDSPRASLDSLLVTDTNMADYDVVARGPLKLKKTSDVCIKK